MRFVYDGRTLCTMKKYGNAHGNKTYMTKVLKGLNTPRASALVWQRHVTNERLFGFYVSAMYQAKEH